MQPINIKKTHSIAQKIQIKRQRLLINEKTNKICKKILITTKKKPKRKRSLRENLKTSSEAKERGANLVAEMDCEGVSALRVLVLSLVESVSNWSKLLCKAK